MVFFQIKLQLIIMGACTFVEAQATALKVIASGTEQVNEAPKGRRVRECWCQGSC